jgi:hypothetical protein
VTRRLAILGAVTALALLGATVLGSDGSLERTTPEPTAIRVAANVSPDAGGPDTTFTVTWTARSARPTRRSYEGVVSLGGPGGVRCRATYRFARSSRLGPAGSAARLRLRPPIVDERRRRAWCPGRFQGQVSVEAGDGAPSARLAFRVRK